MGITYDHVSDCLQLQLLDDPLDLVVDHVLSEFGGQSCLRRVFYGLEDGHGPDQDVCLRDEADDPIQHSLRQQFLRLLLMEFDRSGGDVFSGQYGCNHIDDQRGGRGLEGSNPNRSLNLFSPRLSRQGLR